MKPITLTPARAARRKRLYDRAARLWRAQSRRIRVDRFDDDQFRALASAYQRLLVML